MGSEQRPEKDFDQPAEDDLGQHPSAGGEGNFGADWLERVLTDEEAMQRFSDFYANLLARTQRQISERFRTRFGAEDVMQTTFRTYYRRVIEKKLGPGNEGEAMALITTIAYKKLLKKIEHYSFKKRDGEITLSDLALVLDPQNPSPDEEARVEEVRQLTQRKLPKELWEPLDLVMGGYTASEVRAHCPNVSDYFERLVRKKLRETLEELIALDAA